jgi:hypothetical protein
VVVGTARSVLGGHELHRPGRRRQARGDLQPQPPALGRGKAVAAQWQYDESEVLGASRSKDEPA